MKVQQVLTTPSSAEAVKKSCVNRMSFGKLPDAQNSTRYQNIEGVEIFAGNNRSSTMSSSAAEQERAELRRISIRENPGPVWPGPHREFEKLKDAFFKSLAKYELAKVKQTYGIGCHDLVVVYNKVWYGLYRPWDAADADRQSGA
ncbi:MAG: hypothetical protein L6R37_007617 [Teloschistes peruensis]|nr:MAG: hypothetical protein L6R37_007617 [Teloschistes peruensis]